MKIPGDEFIGKYIIRSYGNSEFAIILIKELDFKRQWPVFGNIFSFRITNGHPPYLFIQKDERYYFELDFINKYFALINSDEAKKKIEGAFASIYKEEN